MLLLFIAVVAYHNKSLATIGDRITGRRFELKFFMSIALGCFFASLTALGGSLTAEVDRHQTSMEEPFWLTITIQGSLGEALKLPDSPDFEFAKTGESTNISIVNGSITKEIQYTFQARPLRQGALSIPSFVAKIDGRDEKTLPISVQVGSAGGGQKSGVTQDQKKLVFVERDLSKASLYEGEAVRSTGRLLTRTRLTGATPARDPSPNWRVIPVEGQRNKSVVRDGANYETVEMDEVLVPLKPGTLTVPQFSINASWIQDNKRSNRRGPHSVFDLFQHGMFNLGEEVSRKLVSEPTTLNVRPLPDPKPANFFDVVGAFSLKSNVSGREIAAGDTITVTVELSGQGALDRMRELKLAVAGARVYDDKPDLNEKVEPGAGLVSTKRFKFAVVPQQSGSLDLGSVNLAAFNPFTERYEELSTKLGLITVKEGTVVAKMAQVSPETKPNDANQQPIQSTDNFAPIAPKRLDETSLEPSSWWLNPMMLAFELLAVLLILAWLLFRKFVLPKAKKKSTGATILSRCEMLRRDLQGGDLTVLKGTLDLMKYVFTTPGQQPNAMTSSDLISAAKKIGVDQSILDSLKRVLEVSDRLQYGFRDVECITDQLRYDINHLIDYCMKKGADAEC